MTTTTQSIKEAYHFRETVPYKQLKTLAQSPYDLTQPKNLSEERLSNYTGTSAGLTLLFGTERISDEVYEQLCNLAKVSGAVEKMQAQQAGEIINFINGVESEHRRVLHTALRDVFENQRSESHAKEASELAKKELENVKAFISEIEKEGTFTDLVTVAIGGSDLGMCSLAVALESFRKNNRRLHFVSNVDPDSITSTLKKIDIKKTLFVVISKSGTTQETVTNAMRIRKELEKHGLNPKKQIVSVTEEGSAIDAPAEYRKVFHIWEYIGGRFTGTSVGGILPLAFAYGFDVALDFLKGANEMDRAAVNKDPKKNIPLLSALISIWNRNFLNYPTLAFVPYSYALRRFPAHFQQVEMESNGKRIDRNGKHTPFETSPVLWGEPGTNAQHSFFQCFHQGTCVTPVEFVGFKECVYGSDEMIDGTTSQEKLLSNLIAQSLLLAQGCDDMNPNKCLPGNRPNHIILGKRLTPRTLGALYAYCEHKVAFEGYIWNINPFDQEGVESGKKLAKSIQAEISGLRSGDEGHSCKPSLGRIYWKQICNLK